MLKPNTQIAIESVIVGAVLFAVMLLFAVQPPWLHAVPILLTALSYFVESWRNRKRSDS
jgi:CHASE2 domain-containing sensor protein